MHSSPKSVRTRTLRSVSLNDSHTGALYECLIMRFLVLVCVVFVGEYLRVRLCAISPMHVYVMCQYKRTLTHKHTQAHAITSTRTQAQGYAQNKPFKPPPSNEMMLNVFLLFLRGIDSSNICKVVGKSNKIFKKIRQS